MPCCRKSGIDIPSGPSRRRCTASPRSENSTSTWCRATAPRPLKDGDVIPQSATSVPPDINALLDTANSGLQAIPRDNLKTAIDEAYTAVGGSARSSPDIVKGSTNPGHRRAQEPGPVDQPDRQRQTGAGLADPVRSRRSRPGHHTLRRSPPTSRRRTTRWPASSTSRASSWPPTRPKESCRAAEAHLPVLMANLASIGQIAGPTRTTSSNCWWYCRARGEVGRVPRQRQHETEPQGEYLSFNLNINVPPACTTGFLPAQRARIPNLVDYPDRAAR